MASLNDIPLTSLIDVLNNSLILRHLSPYLDVDSRLKLAATSKSLQSLIYSTGVFQYLQLSKLKLCWRAVFSSNDKSDEPVEQYGTDDQPSHPLYCVFDHVRRKKVLQDVRTLILDGVAVPNRVISSILCDNEYIIRLLSLRGIRRPCIDHLASILCHLIRPERAEGTPKLKRTLSLRANYNA